MGKAKGNGDEIPEATKAKLDKILDRAHREQIEQEAYSKAAKGTKGGEPKSVRDAWDKKEGRK